MVRINAIFRLLIVLFATASNSKAQTFEPSTYKEKPGAELILAWLHSSDPRLQAWAAHDILEYHVTDLIPDLQAHLDHTTPVTLSDAGRLANFRTTLAILDTLIQLDATVPADTLMRIEKLGYNARPEEFVLLSRLPWEEAEPAISWFYQPGSSDDFAATRVAAQLLAQHPPKGFAARLLATILVTGRIMVHDQNGMGGFGPGVSSSCCGGLAPDTEEWPEIGRYAFQDPPRGNQPSPENETLFLSAPDPIYLVRTVGRHFHSTTCGGFLPLNDAIRSHLVGTLLGGNPASPFPEQPITLDITFRSRESYRAQIQAFVDAQQQNFSRVATALTAINLLTEEERQAAELRVDLSLQDLRTNPSDDLPVLAFRPPVQWVLP